MREKGREELCWSLRTRASAIVKGKEWVRVEECHKELEGERAVISLWHLCKMLARKRVSRSERAREREKRRDLFATGRSESCRLVGMEEREREPVNGLRYSHAPSIHFRSSNSAVERALWRVVVLYADGSGLVEELRSGLFSCRNPERCWVTGTKEKFMV